jgi:apolipoprotein D and lipocalin family protein
MKLSLSMLFAFILMSCAFAGGGQGKLPTAEFVDVGRYVGKWYAVKALPQIFTRDCLGQTAEYEIINDRSISVLNTCLKAKGTQTIKGVATVRNKKTNAELGVKFNTWWNRILFFIKGDYTIIKLDPNYEYVMVGSSNRKSLWYLSRRPFMPEDVTLEYDALAKSLGFQVEKMVVSEF